MVRAVIDTNIWVSALLNPFGYPARLCNAFANGRFEAVLSEQLLVELADVLNRPRIKNKYGLADNDIAEFLLLLEERADHVLLTGNISVCRDKDDDCVIETALRGSAPYIVSRDDDLKFDDTVSSFLANHGISVVTVAHFLTLLDNCSQISSAPTPL
jgi:putative PIN family toxin of toxin-antitoxin system